MNGNVDAFEVIPGHTKGIGNETEDDQTHEMPLKTNDDKYFDHRPDHCYHCYGCVVNTIYESNSLDHRNQG